MDDVIEILSPADVRQQYHNTVVLYKGEPVKVVAVGEGKPVMVKVKFLATQKQEMLPFSLETFKPPAFRLGMLNSEAGAVWLSRKPARVMRVGVHIDNIVIQALDTQYLDGWRNVEAKVRQLDSVELSELIRGEYPDFRTCLEYVKEFATSVAFDRQFAIDCQYNILYKNRQVAKLPKNCKTVERITWHRGYEHLKFVLGDECVTTLSNTRAR